MPCSIMLTLFSEDRNFYHVDRADELGIKLTAFKKVGLRTYFSRF